MFADRVRTGIDWTPGVARKPDPVDESPVDENPVDESGTVGAGGIRATIRARGGGGSGVRGGTKGTGGVDGAIARVIVVGRVSGTGSEDSGDAGAVIRGAGIEGGGGIELDLGSAAIGVASSS